MGLNSHIMQMICAYISFIQLWLDINILTQYLSMFATGPGVMIWLLQSFLYSWWLHPWKQGSWVQHEAYMGPVGPRWAPFRSHESCYLGYKYVSLSTWLKTSLNMANETSWDFSQLAVLYLYIYIFSYSQQRIYIWNESWTNLFFSYRPQQDFVNWANM